MKLIFAVAAAAGVLAAAEQAKRAREAAARDDVAEAVAFERAKDAAAARQAAASRTGNAEPHTATREDSLAAAIAFERAKDQAAERQHRQEQSTAKQRGGGGEPKTGARAAAKGAPETRKR